MTVAARERSGDVVAGASSGSRRLISRPRVCRGPRIATELGRLHQVTLTGPAGTVAQTTTLTDSQAAIYNATNTAPPPRITALTPA